MNSIYCVLHYKRWETEWTERPEVVGSWHRPHLKCWILLTSATAPDRWQLAVGNCMCCIFKPKTDCNRVPKNSKGEPQCMRHFHAPNCAQAAVNYMRNQARQTRGSLVTDKRQRWRGVSWRGAHHQDGARVQLHCASTRATRNVGLSLKLTKFSHTRAHTRHKSEHRAQLITLTKVQHMQTQGQHTEEATESERGRVMEKKEKCVAGSASGAAVACGMLQWLPN